MRSLKQDSKANGAIKIIRASELAKNGTTGVVAEGTLEKVEPNKFNPAKSDYFIRGADNTLYIINETQSLKDQLGQDGVLGLKVRIEYNGKVKTKSGTGFHDFTCFAE
jgi:hypothetical protein